MNLSSHYGVISAVTVWAGLSFLLGGCSVANRAIRSDFTEFNTTLQFNQTQQMLLNVVRMHFRESPMFLQAGSLTAAYESRVGANVGLSREQRVLAESESGVDYSFASKPTVSYATVEGKNYVQQLLTEISPQTFCLLLRAGWPVESLASLLIERVTLPGRNAQGAIPAGEVGDAESEDGQGGRQQPGEKQVPRHDCPVGSAHRHHQPCI